MGAPSSITTRTSAFTSDAGGGGGTEAASQASVRAFPKFSVYKGKGAMQLSLSGPTWKPVNSTSQGLVVNKEGSMFLEFAGIAEGGAGGQGGGGSQERTFNWGSKIIIALRPVELGYFLDQGAMTKGFDIYHDPSMGGPEMGQIKKTLQVKPNPDGSHMFIMSQTSAAASKFTVYVPVTPAEMATIKSICSYAIPRLLGFDLALEGVGR